jgi:electron transport complex protein RnfD
MWITASCALAVCAQSAFSDGGRSLLVAATALVSALAAEGWLDLLFNRRLAGGGFNWERVSIKDGSAAVTALVLTLLLPNKIPLPLAAAGAVFAVGIVKFCFGGLGTNWLNPALGGWLFIRFSWPEIWARALDGSPLSALAAFNAMTESSAAAPLQTDGVSLLFANGFLGGGADGRITGFFNHYIFNPLGASLPRGYISLFSAPGPGIIGDRAILLLLISSIIITISRANRAWLSAVFIAVYLTLIHISGVVSAGLSDGNMLFALMTGGTLVATFFLQADTAVSPKTSAGAVALVCATAALSWYLRYVNHEIYGAILATACANAVASIVRSIESKHFYERLWDESTEVNG